MIRVWHSQKRSSLNALDSFPFTIREDAWSVVRDTLMFIDRGFNDGMMDHDRNDYSNSIKTMPGFEGSGLLFGSTNEACTTMTCLG
jgi:hypothetical protein